MWLSSRLIFTVILTLFALYAKANESEDGAWQWSGFITQGWSISDRNNFFGQSSDSNGTFSFRELGFNGNYQWNNQISTSGQVLSRWAGEVDEGDSSVDYLFMDWSAMQSGQSQAGIRLGRIKNSIGFYNDTRDVAFTRPSALLPQSIYLDRVRELALSSDGISGYYHASPAFGNLIIDAQWGEPQMGVDSEFALLGRDWNGKFHDADLKLIRALYEHDGGLWRVAVTWVDAGADFTGAGTDPFTTGSIDFSLIGYSAQFNQESWSLTAEYSEWTVDRIGFSGVFNPSENTIEAYYLQADYRLDNKWTLFARYDEVIVDRSDKDGKAYQSRTGLPAHQRFAKDWTFGVGYKYSPKLMLRGEIHHVDGTAWLSSLDNPNPFQLKRNWNLFLFQASYRF